VGLRIPLTASHPPARRPDDRPAHKGLHGTHSAGPPATNSLSVHLPPGLQRPKPRIALFTAAALGALFLSACASPSGEPVVIDGTSVPPPPTLDPESIARGEDLYAAYCSECHGADLEGQPNWREPGPDGALPAPPHDSTGHTWHHPDLLLLEIVANGGDPAYGSRMPAFAEQLSEDERRAVLDFIKSRWGSEERELQWWMTAR